MAMKLLQIPDQGPVASVKSRANLWLKGRLEEKAGIYLWPERLRACNKQAVKYWSLPSEEQIACCLAEMLRAVG